MNIRKIISLSLLLTVFAPMPILTKGSILFLKGMTDQLIPLDSLPGNLGEKASHQLSPTMGALFWELPFIYNMYVYGPDNDAIKKLVAELFFKQTDGSLSSTYSYTKIARYFTPEIMGKIIAALYQFDQEAQKEPNQRDKLLVLLEQKITEEIIKPFVGKYAAEPLSYGGGETIKSLVIKGLQATKKRMDGDINKAKADIEPRLVEIVQTLDLTKKDIDEHIKEIKSIISHAKAGTKTKTEFETVQNVFSSTAEIKELELFAGMIEKLLTKLKTIPNKEHALSLVRGLQELTLPRSFISMGQQERERLLEDPDNARRVLSDRLSVIEYRIKELAEIIDQLSEYGDKISLDKTIERIRNDIFRGGERSKKLEQYYKAEESAPSTEITNKDFKKSVSNFGSLIASALKQQVDGQYPHNIVIDILLAFQWSKFSTREQFDEYTKVLCDQLVQHACASKLQVAERYTKEDYERLKTLDAPEEIAALSFDNLVFASLGYNFFENVLPPHVKMLNEVKFKELTFPDCGETSLRNLINALIYDNTTGTFSVEKLKKMGAVEQVINYYTKYNSPAALSLYEQASHDDWAWVVSKQDWNSVNDVRYANEGVCDIDAGITNMFKLVHNLFPEIATFKDLIEKLKTDLGIELSLTSTGPIEGSDVKDTDNDVTLIMQKTFDAKPVELVWQFESGHFELKFESLSKIPFATKYQQVLEQKQPLLKNDQYIIVYLGVDIEKLQKMPLFNACPACVHQDHVYIYFWPQYSFKQKMLIAEHLAKTATATDSEFKQRYIIKLSKSLPQDSMIIDEFMKGVGKVNKEFEKNVIEAQSDSAGLASAVRRVIEDKIGSMYTWAVSGQRLEKIKGNNAAELATYLLDLPSLEGQGLDTKAIEEFEKTKPNPRDARYSGNKQKFIEDTAVYTEALKKMKAALAPYVLREKIYSWKPNLAGVDVDNAFDLIESLLEADRTDPLRVEFGEQFFSKSLSFNVEAISGGQASRLWMSLLNYPFNAQQAETVLYNEIIKLIPGLSKKIRPWAHCASLIFFDIMPGNAVQMSRLLQEMNQNLLTNGMSCSSQNFDYKNRFQFISYFLIEHPLTQEQEKGRLAQEWLIRGDELKRIDIEYIPALYEHLMSYKKIPAKSDQNEFCEGFVRQAPSMITNMLDSALFRFVIEILELTTPEKEQSDLGKAVISGIANKMKKMNCVLQDDCSDFIIVMLSLMSAEHEKTDLGKAVLDGLPAVIEKINSKFIPDFIKKMLTLTIPDNEQKESWTVIMRHMPKLIERMEHSDIPSFIIDTINDMTPEKERSELGKALISTIPEIISKIPNGDITSFVEKLVRVMTRENEQITLGKTIVSVVPEIIARIPTSYISTYLTNLIWSMTREKEQSALGIALISTIPEIISKMPSSDIASFVKLLMRLTTSEKKQSLVGQAIMEPISNFLDKMDTDQLYDFISDILSLMAPEKEEAWLGQLILQKMQSPAMKSKIGALDGFRRFRLKELCGKFGDRRLATLIEEQLKATEPTVAPMPQVSSPSPRFSGFVNISLPSVNLGVPAGPTFQLPVPPAQFGVPARPILQFPPTVPPAQFGAPARPVLQFLPPVPPAQFGLPIRPARPGNE